MVAGRWPQRQQHRYAGGPAREQALDHGRAAKLDDGLQHLGEDAGRVAGPVLVDQLPPQLSKRRAQITYQLARHLANRLRLARQLREVVAVGGQ